MKRALLVIATATVIFGVLWVFGQAPSSYVLDEECKRFQQERREDDGRLTVRIAKLEQELIQTGRSDPELYALKRKRDGIARAPRKLSMRGWDVLLIPVGAARPDPEDYLKCGSYDASRPRDPARLRGGFRIWIQPSGGIAKLLYRLGVSP